MAVTITGQKTILVREAWLLALLKHAKAAAYLLEDDSGLSMGDKALLSDFERLIGRMEQRQAKEPGPLTMAELEKAYMDLWNVITDRVEKSD